jgi:hypothetical protein
VDERRLADRARADEENARPPRVGQRQEDLTNEIVPSVNAAERTVTGARGEVETALFEDRRLTVAVPPTAGPGEEVDLDQFEVGVARFLRRQQAGRAPSPHGGRGELCDPRLDLATVGGHELEPGHCGDPDQERRLVPMLARRDDDSEIEVERNGVLRPGGDRHGNAE